MRTALDTKCSFPTCNRRTTAAGATGNEVSGTGVASHIYSASKSGPRGQGGLSREELAQAENGIWLCSEHAKIVDNNRGAAFPPETLLSYKALQEARVIREIQGLYAPIGWIHEISLFQNPIFHEAQRVHLAKLNLLFGPNNSGKTALTQWIAGCFDVSYLKRWQTPNSRRIHYRVSYLNPEPVTIECRVESDKQLNWTVNGVEVPFNPIQIRFIKLAQPVLTDEDDLIILSNALGLPTQVIRNLVNEIHAFPFSHVRNLRFEKEDDRYRLSADVDGTVPGVQLRDLSGRETETIFIEFATAAARVSGRYAPTVLILDCCPLILFEGIFDFYSHHLLDPDNQFQTIMCIPSQSLDLDALRWKG